MNEETKSQLDTLLNNYEQARADALQRKAEKEEKEAHELQRRITIQNESSRILYHVVQPVLESFKEPLAERGHGCDLVITEHPYGTPTLIDIACTMYVVPKDYRELITTNPGTTPFISVTSKSSTQHVLLKYDASIPLHGATPSEDNIEIKALTELWVRNHVLAFLRDLFNPTQFEVKAGQPNIRVIE